MIPKIIHYCWFGMNPKPELFEKCLESWKKYFPDYKIIEWNEENYNINKCPYIQEAYQCKKWAFVSDYVRFDVLYQQGGIYFDTDVEVIRPFPDSLFKSTGFTGIESSTESIAPGLVYACEPGDKIAGEMLADYQKSHFITNGKPDNFTVNARITNIFEKHGYVPDLRIQTVCNITIYPPEYFCGYDLDSRELAITEKTISVHHYTFSWASKETHIYLKIRKKILKIVGKKFFFFIRGLYRKLEQSWKSSR